MAISLQEDRYEAFILDLNTARKYATSARIVVLLAWIEDWFPELVKNNNIPAPYNINAINAPHAYINWFFQGTYFNGNIHIYFHLGDQDFGVCEFHTKIYMHGHDKKTKERTLKKVVNTKIVKNLVQIACGSPESVIAEKYFLNTVGPVVDFFRTIDAKPLYKKFGV